MRLNDREKNIITVEDPVEYRLPGVGQIQVNPRINLTFAAGLRSVITSYSIHYTKLYDPTRSGRATRASAQSVK